MMPTCFTGVRGGNVGSRFPHLPRASPPQARTFGEIGMHFYGWIAVGSGAAVGAWLRWWLGIVLNPLFPTLPLGTLAANLIAALIMGFAMELLVQYSAL